ncbi:hypothetical protein [Nonomuraea sp. NPDC001699]
MRRTDLTGAADSESWVGLGLELQHAALPGLRPEAANGNRMVLSQGPDAVLFAKIDDDRGGVEYSRTENYRSPLAPLRAAETRAITEPGQPPWYARWAHRFADALAASPIGPFHEGRWVLSLRLAGEDVSADRWRSLLLVDHPDGSIDWFTGSWKVMPLRQMSPPGHGRVQAYRKQAREGILPPALLWWFSGLHCYVILDGHDRLVAAFA